MIDSDRSRYSVGVLRDWRQQAESRALVRTKARTPYRAIASSELRTFLSPGEKGALLALEDEFGCEVKVNAQVPYEQGWLNPDAAVVRGEDLVAIEIYESKNGGFPYFAVEHLIDIGPKMRFPRFRRFVLYVVVVSDASPELDEGIRLKLNEIASRAGCEVYIRMYRLKELLARYNL